jgi:hypothetical protein
MNRAAIILSGLLALGVVIALFVTDQRETSVNPDIEVMQRLYGAKQ